MNTISNRTAIAEIAQPNSIEPGPDDGTRFDIFNAVQPFGEGLPPLIRYIYIQGNLMFHGVAYILHTKIEGKKENRALSLFFESGDGQDGDAAERAQVEEIPIAADNGIRPGGHGAGEKYVIPAVPADPPDLFTRLDHLAPGQNFLFDQGIDFRSREAESRVGTEIDFCITALSVIPNRRRRVRNLD